MSSKVKRIASRVNGRPNLLTSCSAVEICRSCSTEGRSRSVVVVIFFCNHWRSAFLFFSNVDKILRGNQPTCEVQNKIKGHKAAKLKPRQRSNEHSHPDWLTQN